MSTLSTLEANSLKGALEALLLVSSDPVSAPALAGALDIAPGECASLLAELKVEYEEANRGFQLREVAGGWRLFTHPAYHDVVEAYVLSWDTQKLSQAALETLAVIAYHQPVTREVVKGIRGVNSDGVIASLVDKGLVRELGRDPERGQAIIYGTTNAFLEKFGLRSTRDLPDLEQFAPDEQSRQFIRERLSGRSIQSTLEEQAEDLDEERELMHRIHSSFMNSEKMKKHMRCLFTYGGMYLVCNSNLLYHASVPLNADGSFKHVRIGQKEYWGRKLLKKTDQLIRTAYFDEDGSDEKQFALDYVWYMWCGPDAPSFDKDKMATFERYFVADKTLHKETKGHYYALRNEAEVCDRILEEFGVKPGPHSHIINGHVPVKTIKGEKPIKADGKLLVIDGGFSKAYQPETGIAGYTLVYHSHGLQLVQHEPFQSRQKAIEEGQAIKSTTLVVEFNSQRMMVKDTDKGSELVTQIQDLMKLLVAYRTGLIKEKQ